MTKIHEILIVGGGAGGLASAASLSFYSFSFLTFFSPSAADSPSFSSVALLDLAASISAYDSATLASSEAMLFFKSLILASVSLAWLSSS